MHGLSPTRYPWKLLSSLLRSSGLRKSLGSMSVFRVFPGGSLFFYFMLVLPPAESLPHLPRSPCCPLSTFCLILLYFSNPLDYVTLPQAPPWTFRVVTDFLFLSGSQGRGVSSVQLSFSSRWRAFLAVSFLNVTFSFN